MDRNTFWVFWNASALGRTCGRSPKEFAKICYYDGDISKSEERLKRPDKPFVPIEEIEPVIITVWDSIGREIEHNIQGTAIRLTNAVRIESCLDMNNLSRIAGKEGRRAERIILRAVNKFGYEPILNYLSRHIKLT